MIRPKATIQRAVATEGTRTNQLRQAGHQIPHGATIIEGPVIDETIVDGTIIEGPVVSTVPMDGHIVTHAGPACDAGFAPSCGCDAAPACGCETVVGPSCGCDAAPSCGCDAAPSCGGCTGGCSLCGELASPNAWRPYITIGLPQDGWIKYDTLLWWQDGLYVPPLVTTGPNSQTRAQAGVLGAPGTEVLFGGQDLLEDAFTGGRLRFGVWLDRCHTWAAAGEYFNIGDESEFFSQTSQGFPILARPFFNTATGLNDSELVAFPGVVEGTVTARVTSELFGGGFHFKRLRDCEEGCKSWLFCGCNDHFCTRTERLIGYRYLQLDEGIRVTEDLVSTESNNPGSFEIFDQFETRNQFNGLDLGWKYRMVRGFWSYSGMLRMGVGVTRQTMTIRGATTINDPAEPPSQTLEGGLLALSSNIGTYKQNEFTIVPELDLEIGYQLTDRLKLSAGYTFIYWSNVIRPGHQIDLDVNPNQLPPPIDPLVGVARPEFRFDTTDYWVQGLNFGLEYRW